MTDPPDVTQLLSSLTRSDGSAVDQLLPLVYDQLKVIAESRLRTERRGHTLSATALVHEAYIKLVDQHRTDWKNRAHFYAIAARAMRRVLVDYAVARKAEKRGGGGPVVTLLEESAALDADLDGVLAIDQAMTRLGELDARQARVVELRFFGGLSLDEVAQVLDVSLSSVNRDWRTARAFLTVQLTG